jgi:hypothetical protein
MLVFVMPVMGSLTHSSTAHGERIAVHSAPTEAEQGEAVDAPNSAKDVGLCVFYTRLN